jgi:hypothetical protein
MKVKFLGLIVLLAAASAFGQSQAPSYAIGHDLTLNGPSQLIVGNGTPLITCNTETWVCKLAKGHTISEVMYVVANSLDEVCGQQRAQQQNYIAPSAPKRGLMNVAYRLPQTPAPTPTPTPKPTSPLATLADPAAPSSYVFGDGLSVGPTQLIIGNGEATLLSCNMATWDCKVTKGHSLGEAIRLVYQTMRRDSKARAEEIDSYNSCQRELQHALNLQTTLPEQPKNRLVNAAYRLPQTPTPTPAPKPTPTPANPLALTPAEQSEEKVAGIQADNINLRLNLIQEQAQRMTTQLRTQASQLATQQAALDAKIITAHGQDPTKNKIDRTPNSPTYMTIVPITPTPAPAAK